jgi:hypothetical protein
LIIDKKPIIENINKFISTLVYTNAGIEPKDCVLEMEEEEFERGFIHMMKNYIILQKTKEGKDKVVVHGAYFVSSRACKIYDDAVQQIVDYAIWDKITEQEARDNSLNFRMRPLEDFIMNVRMSKNLSDYALAGADMLTTSESGDSTDFNPISNEIVYTDSDTMSGVQVAGLARQMHRITGTLPEKGTTISYFMATDFITGKKIYQYYTASDESLKRLINYAAYEELIVKLFEAVGINSFDKRRIEDVDWTQSLLS